MKLNFRQLTANELEVRVAREVGQNKDMVELLIYKDSRCDMRILDETVGVENWVPTYKREGDTLLCGLGIYCESHKAFIYKWAAGAESNIEATKGEQSDALKRAAFCWGIGRSLYTAPRIIVKGNKYDTFKVQKIEYQDDKISDLRIVNNKGKVVFDFVNFETQRVVDLCQDENRLQMLKDFCREKLDKGEAAQKTLTAFYNYYEGKISEWLHTPNFTSLFEKWIARER